jgi:hypothetical protein
MGIGNIHMLKEGLSVLVNECHSIQRWVRRRYLIWFRPDYVRAQIESRKGSCGRHGCCDLTMFAPVLRRGCFSKKEKSMCLRWGKLPAECRLYPIDEKDKIPETLDYCGFYWES